MAFAAERTVQRPGADQATWFLAAMVAAAFRVRLEGLRGRARGRAEVALARQVAIYLIHTRLGTSLAVTGAVFGRDRTTAAHACRAVEDKREDPRFDTILAWLELAFVAGLEGGAA